MQKVLIILGNYLPEMSANGICCQKIIHEMISKGYDVTVLSNEQYGIKGIKIIDGVEINYINLPVVFKIENWYRNIKKPIFKKAVGVLVKVLNIFSAISTAFSFPLSLCPYCKNTYKLAHKLHKEKNFDIVIGVNFPTDAAIVACKIKKQYKDLLCITYFLDPILEGRSHKFLNHKNLVKKAIKCEKEILEISDIIVAQKQHKQHYVNFYGDKYNNKIKYLGVPLLIDKKIEENKESNQKKTVVYAGSLFPTIRNPKYIIDVFKRIPDIKLYIYTTASKDWLNELIGDADNIIVHSAVPYNEIEQIMSQADALLNIGNSYAESAPSKIIEYLNYRKPIISTYRVDNDSSCEIMSKYPLALLLDERSADLEKSANDISKLVCGQNKKIDYSILKKLYWEETSEAFVEIIENELGNEV